MYQNLQKKDLSIHKLVPLIMLALRFGRINHMIVRLIYGLWVVLYMNHVP